MSPGKGLCLVTTQRQEALVVTLMSRLGSDDVLKSVSFAELSFGSFERSLNETLRHGA